MTPKPPGKRPRKKFYYHGVSHNQPKLFAKAVTLAKSRHLSFSAYIATLVEKDLAKAGLLA